MAIKDISTPETTPKSPEVEASQRHEGAGHEQERGNDAAKAALGGDGGGGDDAEAAGAFARQLQDAASDPDNPADAARITALANPTPLPQRAALYQRRGFWAAGFWDHANVSGGAARDLVDPIAIWDIWLRPGRPGAQAVGQEPQRAEPDLSGAGASEEASERTPAEEGVSVARIRAARAQGYEQRVRKGLSWLKAEIRGVLSGLPIRARVRAIQESRRYCRVPMMVPVR